MPVKKSTATPGSAGTCGAAAGGSQASRTSKGKMRVAQHSSRKLSSSSKPNTEKERGKRNRDDAVPPGRPGPSKDGSGHRKARVTPAAKSPDADEVEEEESGVDVSDDDDAEQERDTDEEIEAAKEQVRSKKTAKRKRRATSPTSFGAAMQGLLGVATVGPDEEEDEDGDVDAPAPDAEQDAEVDGDEPRAKAQAVSGTSASSRGDAKRAKLAKPHDDASATFTSAPTILSLAPHLRRAAQSSRLNERASRLAVQARREREEKVHVRDVIGGWGMPGQPPITDHNDDDDDDDDDDDAGHGAGADEARREWEQQGGAQGGAQGYERRLRKVAQRAVVKLFNAIRAAQSTNEDDVEKAEKRAAAAASDRAGEAVATAGQRRAGAQDSLKGDNALGGRDKAVKQLSRNTFLDMIRSGDAAHRATASGRTSAGGSAKRTEALKAA